MVIDALREQWSRVARPDEEIGEIEQRIGLWHRGNADSRRVAEIPGVGVLTATAAIAAMGDPAAFRSGREFAAWLGAVPPRTAPSRPRASGAAWSALFPFLLVLLDLSYRVHGRWRAASRRFSRQVRQVLPACMHAG